MAVAAAAAAAAASGASVHYVEHDGDASAADIAVAAAQEHAANQAEDPTDVGSQLNKLCCEMKRSNVLLERQLRAQTAGSMAHMDPHEYTVVLGASWHGTPGEFAASPARRKFTPASATCLRPPGLTDAEYKSLFPNHQAILTGVNIVQLKTNMPFTVGVSFSDADKIKANVTAGTDKKYHYVAGPREKLKETFSLISTSTARQNEFLTKFPGWTPDAIRSEGFMADQREGDVVWLASEHPAMLWVESTLRQMMPTSAAAKQEYNRVVDAAATGNYVDFSKDFAHSVLAQTAKDVDNMMLVTDLTKLPRLVIERPGLNFNDPEDVHLEGIDSLNSLLKSQMPVIGTAGFTADAGLNGAQLLKNVAGRSKLANGNGTGATGDAGGAAATSSQHQSEIDTLMSTRMTLTAKIAFTFRSPVVSPTTTAAK